MTRYNVTVELRNRRGEGCETKRSTISATDIHEAGEIVDVAVAKLEKRSKTRAQHVHIEPAQ